MLAQSTKQIYPESSFFLGLNESNTNLAPLIEATAKNIDSVFAGTLLNENFTELEKRYGVIELCCATKPGLLLKILEKDFDVVIYLDPDTYLKNPLDEIFQIFEDEKVQAILTPHLTAPGHLEMEISAMQHGIYNLGFLALRNTLEIDKFLKWWDLRLRTLCIRDSSRGLFTDQTWAGLITGFIETRIIRDPGYNFATWNLASHEITKRGNDLLVDGISLKFAHFSGYAANGIENFLTKFKLVSKKPFEELLNEYTRLVKASDILLKEASSGKREKVHYKHSSIRNKTKYLLIRIIKLISPQLLKHLIGVKRKFF